MRRALPLCLALLGAACSDGSTPPEPRAIARSTGEAPAGSAGEVASMRSEFARPARDRREVPRGEYAPGPGVTITQRVETPGERQRLENLQAARRRAAGSPDACGDLGEATGELRIGLQATVIDTGTVSRANVSAPIPEETRACMRRRIEGYRFPPSDEPVRTISTELVLRRGDPEVTEETRERRVGWGSGFELGEGQSYAGSESEPIQGGEAVPPPSPSSNWIQGPSGSTAAGPSGVSIMGPSGVAIGD